MTHWCDGCRRRVASELPDDHLKDCIAVMPVRLSEARKEIARLQLDCYRAHAIGERLHERVAKLMRGPDAVLVERDDLESIHGEAHGLMNLFPAEPQP